MSNAVLFRGSVMLPITVLEAGELPVQLWVQEWPPVYPLPGAIML